METHETSSPPVDPDAARAALAGVSEARELAADRVTSPWWFHYGQGVAVALFFAAVGLDNGFSAVAAPLMVVVIICLIALVKRRTGVAVNRNRFARGARWVYWPYLLVVVALVPAGFFAQNALHLPWLVAAAGLPAGALTVAVSYYNDHALRREARAGR